MPTEPETTAAPTPPPALDMRFIGPDPQAATAPGMTSAGARPKARTGLWLAGGGLALLAVKVGSVVLHLGVFAHLFNMWPHPGK